MGINNRSSWKEKRTAERNRQLMMLAIPVVLILLIIIIVALDRSAQAETEPSATGTEAPTGTETMEHSGATPEAPGQSPDETAESTGESTAEGMDPDVLQVDAVPEINQLMKQYYEARVACDVEKLNGLYGKVETDVAKLQADKAQLLLYARHVSGADEIVCYTAELADQDIWFVLMTAKFHFRSTETIVPVASDFFVRKDAEGTFTLVAPEEITEEMKSFRQDVIRMDQAILLTRDTNTKMKDAIKSDPVLIGIYGTLNSGSPVWETGEPETEPDVEILPE